LASPVGSELVELATRLIVEEALEGEVRDTLDRGYCERGHAPGQGHRNGRRTHRLKSVEGGLECESACKKDPGLGVSGVESGPARGW
jgi:putative transposase